MSWASQSEQGLAGGGQSGPPQDALDATNDDSSETEYRMPADEWRPDISLLFSHAFADAEAGPSYASELARTEGVLQRTACRCFD